MPDTLTCLRVIVKPVLTGKRRSPVPQHTRYRLYWATGRVYRTEQGDLLTFREERSAQRWAEGVNKRGSHV